jgi:hypothetical protein
MRNQLEILANNKILIKILIIFLIKGIISINGCQNLKNSNRKFKMTLNIMKNCILLKEKFNKYQKIFKFQF